MSFASTSRFCSAFGKAPETSASPPVLAKGTALEVRMATRIQKEYCHKEAQKTRNDLRNHFVCFCASLWRKLALHRGEKFSVGLRLLQSLEHDFHLLDRRERIQHPPHHPDAIEVFLADQQFFLARAGALQVDCWKQSLITQTTIEVDFRVTRTFELFEYHVVHARAGVDQRRGDDRQRAAFLDVARRAEESLRTLQRV